MNMIDENNMDKSIYPGNDFYRFANGNWMKNNPIPDAYSSYGSFHVLHEENEEKLKQLLAEVSEKKSKNEIERKIALFYKLGMDYTKINQDGLKPIKSELDKINEIKSFDDLYKCVGELHAIGVRPFFDLFADQDEKNSEMIIAQFCQGGLGMPDRDYYLNEDENFQQIQLEYKKLIARTFRLSNEHFDAVEDIGSTLFEFEKYLASISMNRVDMRDPHKTYNKFTAKELENLSPSMNWKKYFEGLGIVQFDEQNLRQLDYFKALFSKIAQMGIATLKDYLKWNLLRSTANYLSDEFVESSFEFYGQILSGSTKLHERWKRVIASTNDALGEAVGQIYVEKYFPPQAKEKINNLVESLRSALGQRIRDLTWMQEDTKKKALQKLASMKLKVGYPNKWIDYSMLEVNNDSYVLNVIRGRKFEVKRELGKIGKQADPEEWHMYPQTVNAYYNPTMNEIVFPAAILQPPFFDYKAADAENFGGIGAVIGHEMTHGFDDKGRLYNDSGNLEDWWQKEDEENFKKEAQKLVDLYNRFEPIKGNYINGELTLGENIADLGGVTVSLFALKTQLNSKNKVEKNKNAIETLQKFFLSYANVWKQNMREQELLKRLIVDVHSPAEFRVNGIVYNIPEFYAAFDIKEGDFLYRGEQERIKIW